VDRYKAEAVARASRVLALFDRSNRERSLGEIVATTGVPKITLLGILNVMTAHDFLRADPSKNEYRLGYAWLRLAAIRRNQLNIRENALPVMRHLRDTINETVILSLKVNDMRVHLDYVESTQPIRRITQIGHEGPLLVGAAGLVLLAGLCVNDVRSYLRRNRIKDGQTTLRTVARIKEDGYAVVAGTVNIHTAAVAAPVRTFAGETVAALTISCPRERFTDRLRRNCVKHVLEAAEKLSRVLGHVP
jgi:DNA-binding IclR family transcriptional regulator